MEKVQLSDDILYKYMPVVDEAIIKKLESSVDKNYIFSKAFERKMKKLIHRETHPWMYTVKNIMRKAAIFFVGLLGAAFIFTMSVEAYREKFFETIKTFLEDSVLFNYQTDDTYEEYHIYEPKYIPEGYLEIDRVDNAIQTVITYENEAGYLITWKQMFIRDGNGMVLDTEYDSEEAMEIYGSTATAYLYDDGYVMAYYEYEKSAYLITADYIDHNEIFEMILSINE